MRRVVVPLDGSKVAESILPDARRLAGSEGELVLIHVVNSAAYNLDSAVYRPSWIYSESAAIEAAQHYLDVQTAMLQADGVRVRTEAIAALAISSAIDIAAEIFDADLIACATHGRSPVGRFFRGGTAWGALAHSTVPVLLRHPVGCDATFTADEPSVRRILVPLDESNVAEKALPLAQELAAEWKASIWLAEVVPDQAVDYSMLGRRPDRSPYHYRGHLAAAKAYVARAVNECSGDVCANILVGPIVDALIKAVGEWGITDVVMASHGRTGLRRAVLGSVADDLIQHLDCPIIVIPALAQRLELPDKRAEENRVAVPAH